MSVRVHTADAAGVAVSLVTGTDLVRLYGDGYDASRIAHALVLEDTFNGEAFVLVDTLAGLELLASDTLAKFAPLCGACGQFHEDRPGVCELEPDPWDDDPDFPVADWRYQVANNDTRLGYLDWCRSDQPARFAEQMTLPPSQRSQKEQP